MGLVRINLSRVKEQKLLVENKPLKAWIKKMSEQQDENRIVQRAKLDSRFTGLVEEDERKVFTGLIPEEHFFNDYVEERFKDIMEEQMEMIRLLKKHGMPKYMANRILIVFDDLVGSSLFAGSRGSYFKGINTRHRYIMPN